MALHCPRCGEEKLFEINLSKAELRICSSCRTTIFPERSRIALGRQLMPMTLDLWRRRLEELLTDFSFEERPPLCPIHGEQMVRGRVLDFSAECWRSPCCDLLLLEPPEMIAFLRELWAGSSLPKKSSKQKASWNPLMFIARRFFRTHDSDAEDNAGLAEAQYILKLSSVLGKITEEREL